MHINSNEGAEAPKSLDVFNSIFDRDEYVFVLHDGSSIKFDQPDLWMPRVNEGDVKKVKEVRDAEFQQKAYKLLNERNYDDLLELLNGRRGGAGSLKVTEEEVLQCAEKVKARKARGGKFEFTEEERQVIVQWKRMSKDTNSAIADLFGSTDQTVGKIIRASKEPNS